MKKSDRFYSASQAMKKLEMTSASFFRRVAAGEIPYVTQVGSDQKLYPKRDIDAMALAREMVITGQERIEFSRSTPGDQLEELEIGVLCFGLEYITPLPERIAFQQASENTFWSLKVNGRVAVYGSMFRFPDSFLDDILTGRQIERAITTKHMLKFSRTEPFDIYIDVLASDPRLPAHLRRRYSGLFVAYFANKILDLLANGYKIRTLYTVTASPEGDRLVKKVGFQRMEGKSQVKGRIAYQFPLDEQGKARMAELASIVRGAL